VKLNLSKEQKDYILKLIDDDQDLPEDFKYLLFPTAQKEYELRYAGKMRKEDLLANEDGVLPVPLQLEKIFNGDEHESYPDGWKNMIVFGDNLQFLKTIYENKDPLVKDKIKNKVKLIYIDPPFATSDEFQNRDGAKAYNDKKKGSEFIEFLRRRLLVAREILSDDGAIFVHLDQKMSHYIKVLMDEVFGKQNFRNEIVWFYPSGGDKTNYFQKKHDTILFYSKNKTYLFNTESALIPYTADQLKRFKEYDEETDRLFYWNTNPRGERVKTFLKDGIIDYDVWTLGIDASKNKYPTQKPELLLKKVITATTNKDDIVLDFFAGSGRFAEVAEKLGRKWIACDIGKLSYFTMQKRILQIENSKKLENQKKKYGRRPKSFETCTLGIYDLKKALDLEWDKYREFVSRLFEVDLHSFKIAGFEFDGKKGEHPVKVWDYNKYKNSNVDEAYLKAIHQNIGTKVLGRIYIVAPANNIDFITDYYEIDGLRYYFLKIPYQVIKELHKIPFQKLRQPQSKRNVNDIDETIGFHFIKQPEVKSSISKTKSGIELVIEEFMSQYYKDEEGKLLENFETLSAIFVDKDYNGTQFIMTESFFADDLLAGKKGSKKGVDDNDESSAVIAEEIQKELRSVDKSGLKIPFGKNEIGKQLMVVYTDIYGNDFTEIFTV
jgi:site-specific DNA-methyltransferase (adenine-specific)/adenine-specific DNA-methyltransferase